jgi:hypothetical protein
MQWLVTQLAWEQRLDQLRSGAVMKIAPAPEADEAKRAA